MIPKHYTRAFCAVLLILLLSSCVGIDTKVKISENGSGTVVAEYRLSEDLVAFGELEANKDMLPVPLTKEDVENSLKTAKGLSLQSWSSRKDGTDLIVKTTINFDSLDSLMLYLDPEGKLARYSATPSGHNIVFSLGENIPPLDPEMRDLAIEAFSPYSFKFAIELPSAPTEARSENPAITSRIEGKTAYFEGSMKDIITSEMPPSMSVSW